MFGPFKATHRHYKGGVYQMLFLSTHTETDEQLINYRNEAGRFFSRPAAMFRGWVPGQGPRFSPIGPVKSSPATEAVMRWEELIAV